MLKIIVKIGDTEYDTGSFISGQPESPESWEMVADAIRDSLAPESIPGYVDPNEDDD